MAHEYYFAVDTDDDKGVPFGPVNKDNIDVSRLIIDFTCWLDANESITEISYLTVKANPALPLPPWQANYPLDETSKTPPVDTYPLVIVEQSVIHEGKAVVLDLAAGTPQLSYAVSFAAVAGVSRRRRLVDILMVIDKPLNSAMVADAPPAPTFIYPLVIHTTTILPADFSGRVYIHNDTAAEITVTLPPSPSPGQVVSFLDIIGNLFDYPVTFVGAPGSSTFEGKILSDGPGGTSIVSYSPREDIRFEWTGEYWEFNRRYVYEYVSVVDHLAIRGKLDKTQEGPGGQSGWAPSTNDTAIQIGPWVDKTTRLAQSLYIQHWYDYVGGPFVIASPIGLQMQIFGDPNYYVWGFNMEMDINTTGSARPQHVNYASTVRRRSQSYDVCFAYYGMIENISGMDGRTGGTDVGFELDINCNGPEPVSTLVFPHFGARAIMTMNGRTQTALHPSWESGHEYKKGNVIKMNTPAHTYIARNDGISGGSAPVFPLSGSVSDGAVTWDYGTTIKGQISRALHINAADDMAFGAGIALSGNYYNAVIDMVHSVLDYAVNPNAVGIRMAPDMAIDFTAQGAEVYQARNVLLFNSATSEFQFRTLDSSGGVHPRLSIHSDGMIKISVPVDALDDAAAAGLGVAIGQIYRAGSYLKVRVA